MGATQMSFGSIHVARHGSADERVEWWVVKFERGKTEAMLCCGWRIQNFKSISFSCKVRTHARITSCIGTPQRTFSNLVKYVERFNSDIGILNAV